MASSGMHVVRISSEQKGRETALQRQDVTDEIGDLPSLTGRETAGQCRCSDRYRERRHLVLRLYFMCLVRGSSMLLVQDIQTVSKWKSRLLSCKWMRSGHPVLLNLCPVLNSLLQQFEKHPPNSHEDRLRNVEDPEPCVK